MSLVYVRDPPRGATPHSLENNSRTIKQYLSELTRRRIVLRPPPRVSFEGFKVSTNQWARSLLNVRVRH